MLAALASSCAGHPGSAPRALAAQPALRVDLEQRGIDYPVFRIPALDVTTAGTLIAAYDARPSMADLPSHIAVVVRRSTDGGHTWQPRQIVRSGPPPLGFGDPSLLVDHRTGRIFLFYAASDRKGFAASAIGHDENGPNVLQADLSWSDDDGITWRHRRITAAIKDSAWGGVFAASGRGIQLRTGPHAGRLIQQYLVRLHNANYGVSVISDDDGASWRAGRLVGPGADENKAAELSDGRVMLNSRARPYRLVAWSADGGETYSGLRPDSQLPDPGNNGAIIRYDEGAAIGSARARRLLFVNTADSAARKNLTIRYSCDDGKTWRGATTLEPGSAAYATLVVLANGDVGVLYERDNYRFITFMRFVPRWPRGCA